MDNDEQHHGQKIAMNCSGPEEVEQVAQFAQDNGLIVHSNVTVYKPLGNITKYFNSRPDVTCYLSKFISTKNLTGGLLVAKTIILH